MLLLPTTPKQRQLRYSVHHVVITNYTKIKTAELFCLSCYYQLYQNKDSHVILLRCYYQLYKNILSIMLLLPTIKNILSIMLLLPTIPKQRQLHYSVHHVVITNYTKIKTAALFCPSCRYYQLYQNKDSYVILSCCFYQLYQNKDSYIFLSIMMLLPTIQKQRQLHFSVYHDVITNYTKIKTATFFCLSWCYYQLYQNKDSYIFLSIMMFLPTIPK